MASHLVTKRITAVVPKLRRSMWTSPHRCVATGVQQVAVPQGDQARRRRDVTPFLPLGIFDLWEPVSNNRSMRQMLDTVDRFVEAPTSTGVSRGSPTGVRTPWDILEKPDAFYMRVDMPGLDKSEVNILVEDEELVIRGEHKAQDGGEDIFGDRNRNYNTRMFLPKEVDKSNVKAELKNGVLTVVVPKLKPPEKRVTQVEVS